MFDCTLCDRVLNSQQAIRYHLQTVHSREWATSAANKVAKKEKQAAAAAAAVAEKEKQAAAAAKQQAGAKAQTAAKKAAKVFEETCIQHNVLAKERRQQAAVDSNSRSDDADVFTTWHRSKRIGRLEDALLDSCTDLPKIRFILEALDVALAFTVWKILPHVVKKKKKGEKKLSYIYIYFLNTLLKY